MGRYGIHPDAAMLDRLKRALKSYVFAPAGRPDDLRDPEWEERERELRRDARKIRKALEERKKATDELRRKVARQREEADAAQIALMRELAPSATRLQALQHGASDASAARELLPAVRRLLRGLQQNGLLFVGDPGETVVFDPAVHQPDSGEQTPAAGASVLIREPGVTYRDELLLKAVVTPAS